MIEVLQEAAGNRTHDLMDQPNADGESPRQIFDEIRSKWAGIEESRRSPGRDGGRLLHRG